YSSTFFLCPAFSPRVLHSSPTRRSSDLLRRLLGRGWLYRDEPVLNGLVDALGRIHDSVPVERLLHRTLRQESHRGRSVGLRGIPRVGHLVPATTPQLPRPAAHPL